MNAPHSILSDYGEIMVRIGSLQTTLGQYLRDKRYAEAHAVAVALTEQAVRIEAWTASKCRDAAEHND